LTSFEQNSGIKAPSKISWEIMIFRPALVLFLALVFILGFAKGRYLLVEVEPGNNKVIIGYIYALSLNIESCLLDNFNEKRILSFHNPNLIATGDNHEGINTRKCIVQIVNYTLPLSWYIY
jgi:hypothetical protein